MSILGSLTRRLRGSKGESTLHGSVRTLLDLAYACLQRSDYIGARQLRLKALEHRKEIQDPALLAWLLGSLALTWTQAEEYRERTEFFSQYIAKYPSDVLAYTFRGGSLWYSGEFRKAIEDYSKAIEFNPNDSLALCGRGQVLVECGEFQKAMQDLDIALENIEQIPITNDTWRTAVRAYILNGRGAAFAGLGEFDRALDEFEKSISLCPQNAWVFYNRAEAYENRGAKAKAVADYKLALTLSNPKLNTRKRKYAEVKVKALLGLAMLVATLPLCC